MIRYRLLPDGGFVAGDTETGRTAYAYPTSPRAEAARKRPEATATAILADSAGLLAQLLPERPEYHLANWDLLDEVAA